MHVSKMHILWNKKSIFLAPWLADSMLAAILTVSPKTQYRGTLRPTIPAVALPKKQKNKRLDYHGPPHSLLAGGFSITSFYTLIINLRCSLSLFHMKGYTGVWCYCGEYPIFFIQVRGWIDINLNEIAPEWMPTLICNSLSGKCSILYVLTNAINSNAICANMSACFLPFEMGKPEATISVYRKVAL